MKKQKKQWKYVSTREISFVISEIQQNKFTLKDMNNGSQTVCTLEELIEIKLLNDALQIELDLIGPDKDGLGMEVTAVTILKKPIKWRQLPDRLVLDIPKKYKNEVINVLIVMQGKPQDGLVISNNKFGAPTIFADNWPNRARHW